MVFIVCILQKASRIKCAHDSWPEQLHFRHATNEQFFSFIKKQVAILQGPSLSCLKPNPALRNGNLCTNFVWLSPHVVCSSMGRSYLGISRFLQILASHFWACVWLPVMLEPTGKLSSSQGVGPQVSIQPPNTAVRWEVRHLCMPALLSYCFQRFLPKLARFSKKGCRIRMQYMFTEWMIWVCTMPTFFLD